MGDPIRDRQTIWFGYIFMALRRYIGRGNIFEEFKVNEIVQKIFNVRTKLKVAHGHRQ